MNAYELTAMRKLLALVDRAELADTEGVIETARRAVQSAEATTTAELLEALLPRHRSEKPGEYCPRCLRKFY